MKDVINFNEELGIFIDKDNVVRAHSLFVADAFNRNHNYLLREIDRLCDSNSGFSEEFLSSEFVKRTYSGFLGNQESICEIGRDGFIALMQKTGGQYKIKRRYIEMFTEAENFLRAYRVIQDEAPEVVETIRGLNDFPKPEQFTTEYDLLYSIALGKDANVFRLENKIKKEKSLKNYLPKCRIQVLERLKKVDVGLLVAFSDYESRRRLLEWCASRIRETEVDIS